MRYQHCGFSGLQLSALSLGLWHNFGGVGPIEKQKELIFTAFDQGITHFDLANNYGPPPGSAEEDFGTILKDELKSHRNELVISSKAGYLMWDGPYALIGASSSQQIIENVAALDNTEFSSDELSRIDTLATDSGINIWADSSESG